MEWLLFVLGTLAVGVSLALGYRERRDFARLQEKAGRTRPGELEELSLVVADLEEELTQTAERIIGELEERAATLRRLISEARAVAAEVGAVQVPEAVESEPSGDEAETPLRAGAGTDVGDQPGSPAESGRGIRPRRWRTMEATVWEMSQEGLEVEQIARQLDIGKGEVKLILDLKKAQAR